MTEEMKEEYQVCYRHPDRKTYLRCNKCGRPICPDCAVQTPTGYRCRDCIKEQQKVFDTSETKDYIVGGLIAAALGWIGSLIEQSIPLSSVLTALIVGGLFGKLIAASVRKAANRRRSRKLTITVTAVAAIGAFIQRSVMLRFFAAMIFTGQAGMFLSGLVQFVMLTLYIIVLCSAIWMDMNGMVFGR